MSKKILPSNDNNRLTAIWAPSDFEQAVRDAQAVVAAGKHHRHLGVVADTEGALRVPAHMLSQSRFGKARIMDALAVALLIAVMAAIGAALVFLAAPAKADTDPDAIAYAAHHADAICDTLNLYPSTDGVYGVLEAIEDRGLTGAQAAEAVVVSVLEVCPANEYLLDAFIARYGSDELTA